MPYPNQHAARVKNPRNFIDSSFRTKKIAPGITVILGRPWGIRTGSMTVQAYRFDKDVFTPEEAQEWLKKHNVKYISFEPASSWKENKWQT